LRFATPGGVGLLRGMAINPHHLELFHYVVKHGGIAQASKNMPYGVGQSAISLQITRLESHLGVTLFQRRPFRLTPEGAKLHAQTEGFFRTLDRIETEFRGGAAPLQRIGATELIQADHLPAVFDLLRKAHKTLRLSVRDAAPAVLAELVRTGELDLAIYLFSERPPKDLEFTPLMTVKPVLVVPDAHPAKKADALLAGDRIAEPLVCLPLHEAPSAVFQTMLAKQGRVWEPAFELGSIPLIHRYVLSGYGVGLSVAVPGHPLPKGLRALPLPDAAELTVGMLYTDRPWPLRDTVLACVSEYVKSLTKK
jgi:DNA-binding transcriptional LysR family regulator